MAPESGKSPAAEDTDTIEGLGKVVFQTHPVREGVKVAGISTITINGKQSKKKVLLASGLNFGQTFTIAKQKLAAEGISLDSITMSYAKAATIDMWFMPTAPGTANSKYKWVQQFTKITGILDAKGNPNPSIVASNLTFGPDVLSLNQPTGDNTYAFQTWKANNTALVMRNVPSTGVNLFAKSTESQDGSMYVFTATQTPQSMLMNYLPKVFNLNGGQMYCEGKLFKSHLYYQGRDLGYFYWAELNTYEKGANNTVVYGCIIDGVTLNNQGQIELAPVGPSGLPWNKPDP